MSNNAFDMVRKVRHLPGLQLTATIDPTQITKRVKTAAQQMLRSGVLSAGYRSKSRMLAEQLLSDVGREAPASWMPWAAYITDVALLTSEARDQIAELVEATRMIEFADSEHTTHINERYSRMLKELRTARFGRLHLSTYQREINKQIAEVVASCRTPLMVEIHNELADKLDSTEPFAINF
jgi:hypothetical protein